ncbi:MAG: hypothetical protein K6F93_07680 [Lachnospiraceae bacterium]|nr:hypothetical protein [Lachnospiraceae bacterium]
MLIVSEELYNPILNKHDIEKIIVLAETVDDATTHNPIARISKYTSPKEIFSKIIGISGNSIRALPDNNGTQIVSVYSAFGGAGKTTISLGLATRLAQGYKKVLYINAGWINSFGFRLKDPSTMSSVDARAIGSCADDSMYDAVKRVIRKEGFSYLPPFGLPLISLGVDYGIYEKLAESAKKSKEYDFIIVDADSGFDRYKASLLKLSDKVVVVTKQDKASQSVTDILISSIIDSNNEKYLFVCNEFGGEANLDEVDPNRNRSGCIEETIEKIPDCDEKPLETIAEINGIRRLACLIM